MDLYNFPQQNMEQDKFLAILAQVPNVSQVKETGTSSSSQAEETL